MANRNNAQINPAGYLAKGNGKINLLSPKMKNKCFMRTRSMRPIITIHKPQNEVLKAEVTKMG